GMCRDCGLPLMDTSDDSDSNSSFNSHQCSDDDKEDKRSEEFYVSSLPDIFMSNGRQAQRMDRGEDVCASANEDDGRSVPGGTYQGRDEGRGREEDSCEAQEGQSVGFRREEVEAIPDGP